MALTINSVFTNVTISCDRSDGIPDAILWYLDDDNNTRQSIYFGAHSEIIDTGNSDLVALQSIYASTDGFLDGDGNSIIPMVIGFSQGTTPESLDEYGSFNPLREGAYEQFVKNLRVQGKITQGLSQADHGFLEVRHKGLGFIPEPDKPEGDAFDYPVSDWSVAQEGDDFSLSLLVPYELEIDTVSKLNDFYSVQAMVSWLEAIRVSGSGTTVGSDITADGSFTSRTFTFRQKESDTADLRFSLRTTPSIILNTIEGNYTRVSLHFEPATDNTVMLDVEAIGLYIADEAIGTISTVGLLVNPNHGNSNVPYQTNKIIGPGRRSLEFISDTLVYTGRDISSGMYRLPIAPGYGRSATWAYLEKNSSGHGLVPIQPSIDTIHLDDTVINDVRFREPTQHVLSTNTHRVYTFHNIGTVSRNINDWNDDLLIALEPGQSIQFLVSLEANGDGEILALHPPNRHYKAYDNNVGSIGDIPFFTDGNQLYRLIPIVGNEEYIDTDAFRRGTGVELAIGNHVWEDESDWDFPEILEVLRNGWVNATAGFDISLDDDVTGSISTWNGIRLFHQRGTSLPTALVSNTKPTVSGAGTRETYYVNWRFEAQEGDKIFFTFRYRDGTNIEWDSVRVGSSFLIVSIEPVIRREYSA